MKGQRTLLLVEDDEGMRESCAQALRFDGYAVVECGSAEEAEPHLLQSIVDLVITDLNLPGASGERVVELAAAAAPDVPVIIITAFPSVESAVGALKHGVVDYLIKPFTLDQLVGAVKDAIAAGHARDHAALLKGVRPMEASSPEILGSSEALRAMLTQIRQAAQFDAHVLISGETGSGKELAARAIQRLSPRASKPFVAINCAAIPDTLFDSELFGHVKGAFTGAVSNHRGLLEQADGGTLFLDEIGDLSAPSQAKLLRALDTGTCRRVGGTTSLRVDVRVISATNKDLREEVVAGRFREDMFYRLAALEVDVPPLRERPEDVSLLAQRFLEDLRVNGAPVGFSDAAIGMLQGYDWPGNIRELHNAIQRIVARARRAIVTTDDIIGSRVLGAHIGGEASPGSRQVAVTGFERQHVASVLATHEGNVTHAARALGVHRTTLQRLMRKYGLRD